MSFTPPCSTSLRNSPLWSHKRHWHLTSTSSSQVSDQRLTQRLTPSPKVTSYFVILQLCGSSNVWARSQAVIRGQNLLVPGELKICVVLSIFIWTINDVTWFQSSLGCKIKMSLLLDSRVKYSFFYTDVPLVFLLQGQRPPTYSQHPPSSAQNPTQLCSCNYGIDRDSIKMMHNGCASQQNRCR